MSTHNRVVLSHSLGRGGPSADRHRRIDIDTAFTHLIGFYEVLWPQPGRIDAMALYAGMGVGSVSQVRSAADLVAGLVSRLV
jgi:hypothetical protein